MYAPFQSKHLTLRKQILALTGVFRIYDENENVIAYSRQKMFKLREDIRVYRRGAEPGTAVHPGPQILDFSAAYDVYDSLENCQVGTLRRRGFARSCATVGNPRPGDRPIGDADRRQRPTPLLRRLLLGSLLPQNYDVLINDQRVMDLRQQFNLFRYVLDLDFSENTGAA
jgi:hypothetical protein